MNTPLHILIGDDSISFGWACSETLKLCGHIVNTVPKDSYLILDTVTKQLPDVLIMEAHMKGMNAAELIRAMDLPSGRKPVTVVISSFDIDPLEQEFKKLGVNFYLVRPFDIECLAKELEGYSTPLLEQNVMLFDPISFRRTTEAESENSHLSSEAERITTDILTELNMPSRSKGFHCVKACIAKAAFAKAAFAKLDLVLAEELYPAVAKEFDCSALSIERSIRHAIDLTWNQTYTATDALNYYFSDRKSYNLCEKPSNDTFIFTLAECVRSQLNIRSSC